MKIKLIHIVAISGLLFTFSCAPTNSNPCAKIWGIQYDNPAFIGEVDSVNQQLSLQVASMTPTLSDVQGEIYQEYFVGDFNVVAPFSNFVAGPVAGTDGNPFAEMVLYNSEIADTILDTTIMRAGISRDYIYASIGFQKVKKIRLATTTSGTFRIQKIGNNLLARVIAGGDTVTENLTMPFTPVRFGFRLGSMNDSSVSNPTGIKIDAFPVSGTSDCTLLSDEFKCNSIYIP